MADPPIWHGILRRGEKAGTVVITIVDTWGWEITLHGVQQADHTYKLEGSVGPPPASLRIAGIDTPLAISRLEA